MEYILKRESTASGIGFFGCSPADPMNPPQALAHIKAHPNDEFMRRYVLRMLETMEPQEFAALVEQAVQEGPDAFRALVCEASLVHAKFNGFTARFTPFGLNQLAAYSPLPLLRAEAEADRALQRQWASVLQANIIGHEEFPHAIAAGLSAPCAPFRAVRGLTPDNLAQFAPASSGDSLPVLPDAGTTVATARQRLDELDVFHDVEHRHEASLSPVALLREWEMDIDIASGAMDYNLSGIQTSYGKGLELDTARASLYMEIVERVSSFASVENGRITDRLADLSLVLASREELAERGEIPLPTVLPAPGETTARAGGKVKIHWLAGERADGARVMVPAQFTFLFCNLDEPALAEGLDSTGLASGNIMEQARLSGLYEVLERDAEAVGVFDPARCFRLTSSDPAIGALLADYADKGISIVAQELTTDLGVPAYKVFVQGRDGELAKGTGCSLSSRSALLSALLETMYPYPNGEPSAQAPADLPVRSLESLPEFGTGHPMTDLHLLEKLLQSNGFAPVYVDLTRDDLRLPVCRAFVPGLAPAADFSAYSRLHPRQWNAVQEFMKTVS